MDTAGFIKIFGTTFLFVFLAELGDKTQLATMAFAANNASYKLSVFLGAAIALVLTSGLGVLVGGVLAKHIPIRIIRIASAVLFIGIGVFLLFTTFSPKARAYEKVRQKIEEINNVEKCVHCLKLNDYLADLKKKHPGMDIKKAAKESADFNSPCNTTVCNTDSLKKAVKVILKQAKTGKKSIES